MIIIETSQSDCLEQSRYSIGQLVNNFCQSNNHKQIMFAII